MRTVRVIAGAQSRQGSGCSLNCEHGENHSMHSHADKPVQREHAPISPGTRTCTETGQDVLEGLDGAQKANVRKQNLGERRVSSNKPKGTERSRTGDH